MQCKSLLAYGTFRFCFLELTGIFFSPRIALIRGWLNLRIWTLGYGGPSVCVHANSRFCTCLSILLYVRMCLYIKQNLSVRRCLQLWSITTWTTVTSFIACLLPGSCSPYTDGSTPVYTRGTIRIVKPCPHGKQFRQVEFSAYLQVLSSFILQIHQYIKKY